MKTNSLRFLLISSLLLTLTLSSCAPYGPGYDGYGYGGGGYGGYGRPALAGGAVGGGLIGAAAGGIIGNQSRRGLEGAAIGGLLGALAGSAIQNSRQQQQYYNQPTSAYDGYGYQQSRYQSHCQPTPPPCNNPYHNSGYGYNSGYSPYGF